MCWIRENDKNEVGKHRKFGIFILFIVLLNRSELGQRVSVSEQQVCGENTNTLHIHHFQTSTVQQHKNTLKHIRRVYNFFLFENYNEAKLSVEGKKQQNEWRKMYVSQPNKWISKRQQYCKEKRRKSALTKTKTTINEFE